MKRRYDLTHLGWRPSPYARRAEKSVTLRLDRDVIAHFKRMAVEVGIPYQRIINLYLRECAATGRKAVLRWVRST